MDDSDVNSCLHGHGTVVQSMTSNCDKLAEHLVEVVPSGTA